MKIKVTTDKGQVRKIRLVVGRMNKATGDRLSKVLMVSAINIQGSAQESIQTGPRTGRIYRKKSGRLHQASAPGEFPASDTGQLANSIHVAKVSRLAVRVGSVVNHGRHLEKGTKHMAKRPWLEPSVRKELPALEKQVKALFERAV